MNTREANPKTLPPIALVAVFCVAGVSHLPALGNQLALDDAFILANPSIRSIRTLPAALASPWWYTTNGLYRPLTLASFAIERWIAGNSSTVAHAVNLLLHGIVAVLLARLLARFLSRPAAISGAMLFAVLPAYTEAVASIVGRAELLSALALVTLMLVVTGDAPPSRRERVLACLLGAFALASKEGGVVAPALAFAAAWATPRQRACALRWGASASVGTLLLLTARLAVLGTFGGDAPNPAFRILSVAERIRIALTMVPRIAVLLVLPVPPPIDDVPTLTRLQHPAAWVVVLGVAVLVAVALAAVRHLRHPSAVGLGAWIVAATIAPTANILFPTGVVLTGRTLYAPAMGAALLLGAAIVALDARVTTRGPRWRVPARLIKGSIAVLALVSAVVTWRESAIWRSTASVIAEMRRRQPDDYRSFLLLGYIARDHGRDAEAVAQFKEAAARFPGDPEMLTDGATVALRLRDTSTARAWLAQAVAVDPHARRARTRLVGVLVALGDSAEARRLLADGLSGEPAQRVWRSELNALGAGRPDR